MRERVGPVATRHVDIGLGDGALVEESLRRDVGADQVGDGLRCPRRRAQPAARPPSARYDRSTAPPYTGIKAVRRWLLSGQDEEDEQDDSRTTTSVLLHLSCS